jgi:hypothetical protein
MFPRRRQGGDRQYVTGTFFISIEHIQMGFEIGKTLPELIEEVLISIEIDKQLRPNSLLVYYWENRKDGYTYWYSEGENQRFIKDFQVKIFNLHFQGNPILN